MFDVPYATVVTDCHGELLGARIASDGQWRFPATGQVAEKFATCLIAFEDRYFHYHWGVNPWATGRALMQNLRAGRVVSGGSTLTMQTIRLARRRQRTAREKLIEIILATRLEFRYSKAQILSLYASHAPFGGNVVGLDAAAWRYFGHPPEELSWAEAATLAVLPNAPASVHPAKNREILLEKRNRLLRRLHRRGIMDSTDCELALSEALPSEPLPLPQFAPHLVNYFHRRRPGRQTVTSIDKNLQLQVEAVLERHHAEFSRSDIRNLAAVVIDVRTGQARAYCGNVYFQTRDSGNQVDIIRSPRSTGSILKPFLYCAALQEGEILPDMLLPDIPMNIDGFAPQNFNLRFDGAVPASQAVARSLNVPAVSLLRRYSVPKFHDFLKRAGITTLDKPASHYGLSLILGGAEATLWDVASVYTDMARCLQGLERRPCSLLVGGEADGGDRPAVFRAGAVWQTFEAIKEVNRPEEIDWRAIPSMQPVAWKTGTSFGFRDAWAVGVTSHYAVGVWAGNASGEGKAGLVGARTAGPVMFDLFNLLPASPWFEQPSGELVEAEVCRLSGHLKGRHCDDTEPALLCPAGLRTAACPYHRSVHLSADGRFRLYAHCAGSEATIQKSWFVLPPAWEWFYKPGHPAYKSLPPFRTGCGDDSDKPMQFIYPQGNTRVSLPRQLDGKRGEITFELAHSRSDATVFWHVDGAYLTLTRDFHKFTTPLSSGRHTVTAVDGEGHTLSVRVEVE
jgi:penicillin-binding protein 1C